MAPLFVATVVIGVACHLWKFSRLPSLSRDFAIVFGMFSLFGVASSIWSVSPTDTLRIIIPLAATLFGGLLVINLVLKFEELEQSIFSRYLLAGVILGFVLMALEIATDISLTLFFRELVEGQRIRIDGEKLNIISQGAVVCSLFLWPALMFLLRRGKRLQAVIFLLFAATTLAFSGNLSSFTALAVGLVVFVLVLFRPIKASSIIIGFLVIGIAAAPLIPRLIPDIQILGRTVSFLPHSAYPRIFIWQYAADYIYDDPILGKGLNSSRALHDKNDVVSYFIQKKGGGVRTSEPIPLHPHNGVLQIWLELGAIGASMLLVLLILIIRHISSFTEDRLIRSGCYAAFFTCLTVASISYGIWQSWWLGTLWFMAAFLVGVGATENLLAEDNPKVATKGQSP